MAEEVGLILFVGKSDENGEAGAVIIYTGTQICLCMAWYTIQSTTVTKQFIHALDMRLSIISSFNVLLTLSSGAL